MVCVLLTVHRTNGSISQQSLLDDDKLYLPESDIYLATTKSGKPAIARKKHRDVLCDRDFDFIGQSLGVPSRADFSRGRRLFNMVGKRPRSKSAYDIPIPRVIEIDTDDEDVILAAKAKRIDECADRQSSGSSSRSTITPKSILRSPKATLEQLPTGIAAPRLAARLKRRSRTLSHPASSERTGFALSESDDDSPLESTVPLDPASAIYTPLAPLHFHPMAGYMPNYHHPLLPGPNPHIAWSSNVHYHASPNATANSSSSNLPPQQAQSFGTRYPSFPAMGISPSIPVPCIVQGQTDISASIPQTGFVPPQPPPPPGAIPNGQFSTAVPISKENAWVKSSEDDLVKEHFEKIVKPKLTKHKTEHTVVTGMVRDQSIYQQGGVIRAQEFQKKTKQGVPNKVAISDVKQTLNIKKSDTCSKASIIHIHVCAGCGKTRSKGYHMTHPVKGGEAPEPDYCRRCVVHAEYTDSEATKSAVGSGLLMVSRYRISIVIVFVIGKLYANLQQDICDNCCGR